MSLRRRYGLHSAWICLCAVSVFPARCQSSTPQTPAPPPAQAKPQNQPPPAPQPKPAKPQNPFETVPQAEQPSPQPQPQAPKPPPGQKPGFEAPKPVEQPKTQAGPIIESIGFKGARRVPQDTLRALIYSKKGDIYNEDALHRDFMALWNTGRFDDIRLETEQGPAGMIVTFVVTERRVVRS